jgi:hypothetical protein
MTSGVRQKERQTYGVPGQSDKFIVVMKVEKFTGAKGLGYGY